MDSIILRGFDGGTQSLWSDYIIFDLVGGGVVLAHFNVTPKLRRLSAAGRSVRYSLNLRPMRSNDVDAPSKKGYPYWKPLGFGNQW